ncbi:MAG: acetolactate synthase catalytic subunit [Candidatus Competibacterales bacterium]
MNHVPQSTAGDALAAALARHGVELTFGQSLPSAVQLANQRRGIRQIGYRAESTGCYMADGYARVARRIGVVTAQNGPAATLLVPGLGEALKASIPLLALVQDIPRPLGEKNAFQDFDHRALFAACSKWVGRVETPERLVDYLDQAIVQATTGPMGPAVLLLPVDLLDAPAAVEASPRRQALGDYPLDRTVADPARIAAAAGALTRARRPLIVAGGGVHSADASGELAVLQERAGLPVATTVMGKGAVAEDHPLSLGVIGYIMGRHSPTAGLRDWVRGADVVLLVGTRTNQNGTDSWRLFADHTQFIHLDVDGGEVGRNYEALRLVGDAKLTLQALGAQLGDGEAARRNALTRELRAARQSNRGAVAALLTSNDQPVRPERLVGELQKVLTEDTVVVADASYASVWIAAYLQSLAPGMRFITPRGLAGLGWGYPMALGAKLARPSAPVLCLVGDGGFAHAWQELETATRLGINVVVTVLNNQVLAYQKDAEVLLFGRSTEACDLTPVDHAAIAVACGCRGVRIQRPGDYGPTLARALADPQTTVIDVLTDPSAYPPVTAFDALDGARRGT